ncbi:hypothetical protein ACFX19_009973 [Malus domestica]
MTDRSPIFFHHHPESDRLAYRLAVCRSVFSDSDVVEAVLHRSYVHPQVRTGRKLNPGCAVWVCDGSGRLDAWPPCITIWFNR